MKRFIMFIWVFFAWSLSCIAVNNPYLEYLGIEQGLSNNAVTTIYQDSYGFMWFGTYEGLNRYDGYNFKVFKNRLKDQSSLVHNWIVTIHEDFRGDIWTGTKGGVSIYNNTTGKFSSINYIAYPRSNVEKLTAAVNDLETDSYGNMFIATGGKGLFIFKKNARIATPILYNNKTTRSEYHAQDIDIDKRKQIWVFIQGEGLAKYDKQTKQLKLVTDFIRGAKCILADNDGNIWIGTESGLYRYNEKDNSVKEFHEGKGSLSNDFIHKLSLDSKGNIWVSTDGGGITIVNNKTSQISYILPGQEKGALKSGAVDAVFEDRDNRIWIGTLRGGINVWDTRKNAFTTISNVPFNKNSLINDFILSFCEGNKGDLWIGTDGAGISYWDRKNNLFRNYRHISGDPSSLSNNNISRIIRDSQNQVWIATYGGGINKFNPSTNSFVPYPCLNSDFNYYERNVWSLYEDRQKNVWAGACTNGGFYVLNREDNKFELFDSSLRDVITVAEDRSGALWAGTFNQLILVDRKLKKHRAFEIGYPVRAIYEDEKGRFWVGTEGGGLLLLNKRTGVFKEYSEHDGLPSNSILNILEDKRGNLWLSTFNGLSLLNPDTKEFKNFYESDGLQSNQFNYNAALALSSGEFLFGGIKGFNIFHPESIKPYTTVPKIFITGLRINNIPYELDSSFVEKQSVYTLRTLELPYDKAVISVDFAALDYSGAQKISYSYFLEGWDNSWNNAGKSRIANYSKLREGTYFLKIKSTNAEGAWVDNEKVLKLIILPPWWRTWWAYLGYLALALMAIHRYTLYQRSQGRLKHQVQLANMKVEQEMELNEKKLSFFTHISHEFRTPLTLIISPIQEFLNSKNSQIDSKELTVVYRNARRLLSLVDQLLHFRKSDADDLKVTSFNMVTFCKEVYLCFIQQAKLKNLNFDFVCDREEIEIFADKEKIEIALFNLISNAFKYTSAGGTITFTLSETSSSVQVTISDSGTGISEEEGARLFDKFYQVSDKESKTGFGIGLYLVKKFIEGHSGTVSYHSKKGEGTEFTVELLLGKDHFDPRVIFESVGETPVFMDELIEDTISEVQQTDEYEDSNIELISEKSSMLIIDDNDEIRNYVKRIFQSLYIIYEANSGEKGYELVRKNLPDIIITDVVMGEMSGVELCSKIKEDPSISHIPVILLTSSSSAEIKLKGIEGGADDYITKPFNKDILIARVANLLKSKNNLQRFFYNQITFKSDDSKVSPEYKEFLEKCITITEKHLDNPNFNIQILADEVGMSHSALYKKVKSISGRSVNEFIRFIRLRKAAGLFINSNCNVNEGAFQAGFNDIKYFREQFSKLFGMKPSEYIKKYRNSFNRSYKLNDKINKG